MRSYLFQVDMVSVEITRYLKVSSCIPVIAMAGWAGEILGYLHLKEDEDKLAQKL